MEEEEEEEEDDACVSMVDRSRIMASFLPFSSASDKSMVNPSEMEDAKDDAICESSLLAELVPTSTTGLWYRSL